VWFRLAVHQLAPQVEARRKPIVLARISVTPQSHGIIRPSACPRCWTVPLEMASTTRLSRLRPQLTHAILKPYSRLYHSYDHPSPPGPFTPTETSILSAALPHIPSHGFTHTSLSLGAKDAGYLDVSTNIFPRGAFSLVHYHLVTKRLGLAAKLQDNTIPLSHGTDGKPLGLGAKVKALTWARLMDNKDIIHRWQEVRLWSSMIC
jgi:ubiquinone biosynthesis protein COQ9